MAKRREKRPAAPDPVTVSAAEVGELFGLTPRRVQQLVGEGVLPKPPKRGRYELHATVRAYVQHLQARIEQGEGGPVTAIETARLRAAQAEERERRNAEARGELVSLEETQQAIAEVLAALVQSLSTLKARKAEELAAESDPRRVVVILDAEQKRIRDETSAALYAIAGD